MALTEEEAFQVNANDCYFNAKNIQEQISWLKNEAPKNLIRTVTFYRKEDGSVSFKDDPNGKTQLVWSFSNPSSEANLFKWIDGYKAPVNDFYFSIGGDPYNVTEMMVGKGSKGVIYVYRKDNDGDEDSGMPILRYCDRPKSKAIFYDYVMMVAEYFSCKINMECDFQDWREYWERQGKHRYMMKRPKSTIAPNKINVQKRLPGQPSKDPFSMQVQFDMAYNYFEYRTHKVYFIELLEDALIYDHTNRTKSDDTVAFSLSLCASTENMKANVEVKTVTFLQLKKPKVRGASVF